MDNNNRKDKERTYALNHTTPLPAVLNEIERQTFLKTYSPGLLVGAYTGRFLMMVSQMIKPLAVLEIGSFTGYSAICLSAGVPEGGEVLTIEVNPERAALINEHIQMAGVSEKVKLMTGDALEILPEIKKTFDLIFIDGNKMENERYFEAVFPKLRVGGFLLVDNVLWYGKIASGIKDKDSDSIRTFNKKIHDDNKLENILLPIGDGLLLTRKLKD